MIMQSLASHMKEYVQAKDFRSDDAVACTLETESYPLRGAKYTRVAQLNFIVNKNILYEKVGGI